MKEGGRARIWQRVRTQKTRRRRDIGDNNQEMRSKGQNSITLRDDETRHQYNSTSSNAQRRARVVMSSMSEPGSRAAVIRSQGT